MPGLTDQKVIELRHLYAQGNCTLTALARQFGCSLTAASFAVRGLTFQHLPGAVETRKYKLRPDQVAEARRLYRTDPYATYGALARQFGVSYNTIIAAIKGDTFQHVTEPPAPKGYKKSPWYSHENLAPGKVPPAPGPNSGMYRNRREKLKGLATSLAQVIGQPYAVVIGAGGHLDVVPLAEAQGQPLFVAQP